MSSDGAFQGLTELSLVLPDDLWFFRDAWGGLADVQRWALPRLQRLHLGNTHTSGATALRSLAMASGAELHLHAAIGLLDDGGDLCARCSALRREHLAACKMAVTAVQAPRLPGGQASVVLDCSVYPRASLPSRAGRPDVTAFGRWDDPSGNSAHAVGRFVSAHVGDRRWGARRWHRAGVIRRRRRRRRRGGAGASADGAGEIGELPAVSPTGLRGGALALAALAASAAATAAAAWLAAGDRSADGVGAEAAAATYTVPPAPQAATAAAAREMATACWAAADARSGRRRVGAPCTRRVYCRPPGGVAAEAPLCLASTDASLVAADAVADRAADGDAGGWGLAGLRRLWRRDAPAPVPAAAVTAAAADGERTPWSTRRRRPPPTRPPGGRWRGIPPSSPAWHSRLGRRRSSRRKSWRRAGGRRWRGGGVGGNDAASCPTITRTARGWGTPWVFTHAAVVTVTLFADAGRHPVLDGIVEAVRRVLIGGRAGVPLGTLVTGVDFIRRKADERHRHFAVRGAQGAVQGLAATAARRRRIEFGPWPILLVAREAAAAARAASCFRLLYDMLVYRRMEAEHDRVSVLGLLDSFVSAAPAGEFAGRLALLAAVAARGKQKLA